MKSENPPWVLIVEDQPELSAPLESILRSYEIRAEQATTAQQALKWIRPNSLGARPSAVILDLMFRYDDKDEKRLAGKALDRSSEVPLERDGQVRGERSARDDLDPHGQDPDAISTGVNLLRALRAHEKVNEGRAGWRPVWVAVTTARTAPKVLDEIRELLEGRGKIYSKPYDDLDLEVQLCRELGLECKLDPALIAMLEEGDEYGAR